MLIYQDIIRKCHFIKNYQSGYTQHSRNCITNIVLHNCIALLHVKKFSKKLNVFKVNYDKGCMYICTYFIIIIYDVCVCVCNK